MYLLQALRCQCLERLSDLAQLLTALHRTFLPRRSRGSGLYPGWAQKFSLVHALTAVTNSLWLLQRIDSPMRVFVLTFLALQGLDSRLGLWFCHRLVPFCISFSPHYPLLPLHTAQCRLWHCQALLHGTHVKDGHSLFLTISFWGLSPQNGFIFMQGALSKAVGLCSTEQQIPLGIVPSMMEGVALAQELQVL